MATVLIGADICPIEGNLPYFKAGDAQNLFNDLLPELEAADLVIANLECPLIDNASPIFKTGPTFGESPQCINGIKNAGIDVLCLANNHILDHGEAGLKKTMEVCAAASVSTVGAGRNLAAAREIVVRNVGNLRIGILAIAEQEFSIATKNSWGANPLDLIDFVRNVKANQDRYDYLIVLLHGSDEFHVPTPRIKDTCHFMIEMGANVVAVQHPHTLGGYEDYAGGHIIYGQGALVMDEGLHRNRKSFHEGFLVKIDIAEDATSTMTIVPFTQSDPVPGARKMDPAREAEFRRMLDEQSAAVKDDAEVEARWLKFCEENKHAYLSCALAHNRVLSKLNAQGWLVKMAYGAEPLIRLGNIVRCETHREAIVTIFNRKMI